MKYEIVMADIGHSGALAGLHKANLPNDFLPSLGMEFLSHVYYPAALSSKHGITFVAVRDDRQPVGFVTVAHDSVAFSRAVLQGRIWQLARYAMLRSLVSPRHLLLSFEVLWSVLHPRVRWSHGEIVFIAVDRQWQGKGVGTELIARATEYVRSRGCKRCCTKTLSRNSNVIRLYQLLGWRIVDRYRLIGNEYVTLATSDLNDHVESMDDPPYLRGGV